MKTQPLAINCSDAAAKAVLPSLRKYLKTQEGFAVLMLNSRNVPIGKPYMIALGSATSVEVHPREVFRAAIKRNAVSIIMAHNHPSGDVSPSPEDIMLTQRLVGAGAVLGITVHDHVILAAGAKPYSFADKGQL